MLERNRKIQELLVDYAGALRDGSIPVFLKSLTREEGRTIAESSEFQEATEVVRALNAVGFADKAVTPDVGLFISRVDAKIASLMKGGRAPSQNRRADSPRRVTKAARTEKPI